MKKRSAGVLLAVMVLVLAVSPMPGALAADGDLDTTFDTDGKVTTPIGSANDEARSVAIQSDGKIVTAGWSHNGTNRDFALARYNTDGSLDTSFSSDGKVVTAIGSSDDEAHSVAIQSDGKIVAAGYSHTGSSNDFALARYNANGSLDTTFDTDGKVTTDFGSSTDVARSVAIQSSGRIVAAGYSNNGTDDDFALARYNANGSLDTTFDTDGKVVTAIGSLSDAAHSVAIQSDGRIVAAGWSNNGSNYDFALARYNTDGSLDTTFDTDGKVVTAIGSSPDGAFSVAIQSDGKIVAAGWSDNGTDYDFALARYNSASPYRPDAQIRGGLASSYIGKNIYNLGGGGQTFGRQVRPGFSDQFNVKMQNDGNVIDRFFVHGEGSSTRFRITYFSGATNVTGAVVAGTFQTPNVQPGSSRELKVVILVRPGVSLGSTMTDLISVRSKGDPSVRDVVGARVVVSKKAGDFNSQLPIP